MLQGCTGRICRAIGESEDRAIGFLEECRPRLRWVLCACAGPEHHARCMHLVADISSDQGGAVRGIFDEWDERRKNPLIRCLGLSCDGTGTVA